MTLKLGPLEYEIIMQRLDDDNIAEISYRAITITVDNHEMTDQAIRGALCHEIAHAMLKWFGISTDCAEGMGQLLLDFVQRNPDLIVFLRSGIEE